MCQNTTDFSDCEAAAPTNQVTIKSGDEPSSERQTVRYSTRLSAKTVPLGKRFAGTLDPPDRSRSNGNRDTGKYRQR